jgi:hypothetical protein
MRCSGRWALQLEHVAARNAETGRAVKSWLPSVFALAAVSCVVAIVLALWAGPMSLAAATFVAAAAPAMLAPLFWLREGYSRGRFLKSALGSVPAIVLVALMLRIALGASVMPGRLVLATLVVVAMLAVAHQAATLIEDMLRRLEAGESPAREWSYWTVTAILWLASAAPLWLGPVADLAAGIQPRLPSILLGSSPLAHLAVACGHDVLRDQWVYAHTSLGALQVDYPRLPLVLSVYVVAAVALSILRAAEARVVGGLALLVVGAGLGGAAQAADPLEVEVVPAWHGWSRPGRLTEAEVRLQSQRSGVVDVVIAADGARVRTRLALDAGQASVNHIPLRAAETIAVAVRRNGKQRASLDSRLSLSESPLLAWAAPLPVGGPFAGFHAVAVEPTELPRTAAAYSSIDALVIDRRVMASLGQQQLAALLSYVAGCGRTIVISKSSPADEGLFRAAVGCGGRGFATVAAAGEVAPSLAAMLAIPAATSLETPALATVTGPDLRGWYAVATVLAVCAAAILTAGIFTSSLALAIGLPALLATAALWFMQARAPESRLTVWAESAAGERVAQYRGLLQSSLLRRGHATIPVPATLSRPQTCRGEDHATWSWDAAARRFSAVQVDGRLFGSVSLCFAGEFPVARSAVLRPAGDGRMALGNAGGSSLPSGILAWRGGVLPFAELQPAAQITLDPGRVTAATGGAQGLALSRTPPDAQSILWPLDLGRVRNAPAQSQAWLLMRIGSSEQG